MQHGLAQRRIPDLGENWQDLANCRDSDPEFWFPERDSATTAMAKKICAKCLVEEKCLTAALERREFYGVWGGTSEVERRKMFRQRGIRVPEAA